MIEWIRSSSEWKSEIHSDLYIRRNPWPGEQQLIKKVAVLPTPHMAQIYRACLEEVEEVILLHRKVERLIEENNESIQHGNSSHLDYSDLGICLAAYVQAFRDQMNADTNEVYSRNPKLHGAILEFHGGIIKFRRYLYPTPRVLAPFVLLLAIHTRYNVSTLLLSCVSDFTIEQRFGEDVFFGRAYKGRARKRQLTSAPVDSSFDNPAVLVEFIKTFTSRIRDHASPRYIERLFIFVPEKSSMVISGYKIDMQNSGADMTWVYALERFCTRHDIPKFSLNQIRPTILDIGREAHGGDIQMVRALANHSNVDTTYSHYTSDAQRQRNAEQIGSVMQLRERWLKTDGLIDPRSRPQTADFAAATPGWRCLDPYSSPLRKPGDLCDAYGQCPACPLATLDLSSTYACAQAHELLDVVRQAQQTMSPQAWMTRMAPVQHRLIEYWLPAFSEQVVSEAKRTSYPKMPIPE